MKITADGVFGQVLRNASFLLSGNTAAGLLNLAALIASARYLGPEYFGVLILVQTYALIVDRLLNFQSWQALIKFGSELRAREDWLAFKGLIKVLLLLDIATAVVASLIALGGIAIVAPLYEWGEEVQLLAALFCISIAFHLSGIPVGVLRFFEKYGLLVAQEVLVATVKVFGALGAIALDVGVVGIAIAWIAADILGQVAYWVFCATALKQNDLLSFARAPVPKFNGLWSFVWTTNLNASVRLVSRELDVAAMGLVLGSAVTGIYKVAKQLGAFAQRVTDPLYVAIYPELTRQRAAGDSSGFISLIKKTSLSAASVGLVVWIAFVLSGDPIIMKVFGPEYSPVYEILSIYLIAVVLALLTLPLQPAMLALGQPHTSLIVLLASTVLYVGALLPLMEAFGASGAAVAYIVFYVLWGSGMAIGSVVNLKRWATN